MKKKCLNRKKHFTINVDLSILKYEKEMNTHHFGL